MLLGGIARNEVAEALFQVMRDGHENEETRLQAAIQISITIPVLANRRSWIDRLLEDLKQDDESQKRFTALALGWEGNHRAVLPLIELLYDDDDDIQQTAVNALFNLNDDRIWGLMLDRLEHGAIEQQRAILLNLTRLTSRRKQVAAVYRRYLTHTHDDLRFETLVLFGTVTTTAQQLPVYKKCLMDPDARIRALVLDRLSELSAEGLAPVKAEISALARDMDKTARHAALALLAICAP